GDTPAPPTLPPHAVVPPDVLCGAQAGDSTPHDAGGPAVTRDVTFTKPDVPGYEVYEAVGRVGMGVVYLARNLATSRVVALKMILSGALADAEEAARFRIEVEAIARV